MADTRREQLTAQMADVQPVPKASRELKRWVGPLDHVMDKMTSEDRYAYELIRNDIQSEENHTAKKIKPPKYVTSLARYARSALPSMVARYPDWATNPQSARSTSSSGAPGKGGLFTPKPR